MKNKKNLSQVNEILARELKINPKDTKIVLDRFLQIVKDELHSGVGVTLTGFGAFKVQHRAPRRVRNPRISNGPGAFKNVEAMTVFRFRPGVELKPGAKKEPRGSLRDWKSASFKLMK